MMMFALLVRVLLHLFFFVSSSVVVVFAMLSCEVGHCSLAGHAQPHRVTVVMRFLHPQYIFGNYVDALKGHVSERRT
jgi:hypothetical protein